MDYMSLTTLKFISTSSCNLYCLSQWSQFQHHLFKFILTSNCNLHCLPQRSQFQHHLSLPFMYLFSLIPVHCMICGIIDGHSSEKVVKVVLTNCKIPLLDSNSHSFCLACCFGKIHKFPFRLSYTTYTKPLQLVHFNLWGPSPMLSSSGYRYYINFIDEFSCFTWIFFVKA